MSAKARAGHLARNVLRPCSVSGCPRRRVHTSQFCAGHAKRHGLYGSPTGRPFKPAEFAPYERDFNGFLREHYDSPQVQAAIQFFDDLLSLGRVNSSQALLHLQRLCSAGVNGAEALRRIAAVWLLSRDRPKTLPDDDQLTMTLGAQLFKLRPVEANTVYTRKGNQSTRYAAPPGIARREVGELIRSRLGVFFLRVEEAMTEQIANKKAQAIALAQPFPPSAPLQENLKP